MKMQAVFGAIALLLTTEPAEAREIEAQLPAEVCTCNVNSTVGLLIDQPVYTKSRCFQLSLLSYRALAFWNGTRAHQGVSCFSMAITTTVTTMATVGTTGLEAG
jgi:hypothetical protein